MTPVSVIVPAFDAERFLAEALESVLAQTHPPAEVVVVDDGSTDGTRTVAERYAPRVRLVAQPHAGIGAARNRGLAATSCDLVAFLDADDVWRPEKTAVQLDALAADPQLELVFAHVEHFDSGGASVGADPRPNDAPIAAPVASTMLARRDVFERVGAFPTELLVTEYLDWYLRAREAGVREITLADVLAHRRVHGGNNSFRLRHRRSEFASILKASLDRRRAQG